MVVTMMAGREFRLTPDTVEQALEDVLPETARDHYVVVAGLRYPPKQAIAAATGLDRADFTTHHARRTLRRLGFVLGRVHRSAVADPPASDAADDASDPFEPFRGRWVLARGAEVLVSSEDEGELIRWLVRHGLDRDDSVLLFPVPKEPVN